MTNVKTGCMGLFFVPFKINIKVILTMFVNIKNFFKNYLLTNIFSGNILPLNWD
jgi:hypothetical protein